jgi:serine/threonine protein kinase
MIAAPTPGVTLFRMAPTDGATTQPCASCGRLVETEGLEPFSRVDCPSCGAQVRVARVFETYEVVEPLGTGGMGSVFKARDARLNRFVALKLLRKEFAGDETFTAKLQEEARITASIQHPHVVEVFSVGTDHGQFYVVMELVDGGSLDDRIEDEKRISEMRAVEVGLQVAKGLQAALAAGLIHRDIKPGNILFTESGTAKIVDFGLALLAAQHAEAEGEIWGTPYYIAPERLTGEPEDFRSDLYSLGTTLFHAVAGRPTLESETLSATELKELKANPPNLRAIAPHVSEETAAVIDRMLQPNVAHRQTSYRELIEELEAARNALLAREEELRARWSLPVRILVSLGILLSLGAVACGLFVGLHHLPDWRSHIRWPNEKAPLAEASATPAVDVAAALEPARAEFTAGHYGAAEALFRQAAEAVPALIPFADFCAALQLWERGSFAEAAAALRKFRDFQPPTPYAWMNEAKPLAQSRLEDYRLYEEWQKAKSATRSPEERLKKIRALSVRLKTKGALSFQIADEEAKIVAEVAALAEKRATDEKQHAAAEAPRWQTALVAVRHAEAAYRFEEAIAALEKVGLTASSLQAARDAELQRARWLADWKTKLLGDINGVGYDGPVRRATAHKIELKTRYGSVMTDWWNLSPKTLLTMSSAFIRPGVADDPDREWLCAIFAAATGQKEAADRLATEAAATKPQFRDLLPRFFPAARK